MSKTCPITPDLIAEPCFELEDLYKKYDLFTITAKDIELSAPDERETQVEASVCKLVVDVTAIVNEGIPIPSKEYIYATVCGVRVICVIVIAGLCFDHRSGTLNQYASYAVEAAEAT